MLTGDWKVHSQCSVYNTCLTRLTIISLNDYQLSDMFNKALSWTTQLSWFKINGIRSENARTWFECRYRHCTKSKEQLIRGKLEIIYYYIIMVFFIVCYILRSSVPTCTQKSFQKHIIKQTRYSNNQYTDKAGFSYLNHLMYDNTKSYGFLVQT